MMRANLTQTRAGRFCLHSPGAAGFPAVFASLFIPGLSRPNHSSAAMASALCAKPCVGLRSSGLSAARRSARVVVPVRAMADKAQVRPRVLLGRPGSGWRVLERLPRHVNLGTWPGLPAAPSATGSPAPVGQGARQRRERGGSPRSHPPAEGGSVVCLPPLLSTAAACVLLSAGDPAHQQRPLHRHAGDPRHLLPPGGQLPVQPARLQVRTAARRRQQCWRRWRFFAMFRGPADGAKHA